MDGLEHIRNEISAAIAPLARMQQEISSRLGELEKAVYGADKPDSRKPTPDAPLVGKSK